jgi:RHS repeat-associated protein
MQLSSDVRIPDGLLAANALLSEKPHQGVPSWNLALHQGIDERNSTAAIGLRVGQHLNRAWSRYTGKERDTESGLDYFGARYYASNMGRWMSPDWADKPEAVPYSSLDNPQSLNLYGYVLNNPLRNEDADGHECCDGLKRFASGVVDTTVAPIGQMIRHPGDAITGVGMAVIHPLNTLGAMKDAAVSTGEAALSGDAYAIGEVVGTALSTVSGAEEAEVAGDVAKVGEAAKTVEQMAGDLSKEAGTNSVGFTTGSTKGRIDLAGDAHFDKTTQTSVPTPHVQTYQKNVGPNGKVSYSRNPVRPATKADIRTARRLLEEKKK